MRKFLVMLAALGLVACGKIIDHGKLEATVKDGCAARNLKLGALTCPGGRKAKQGDKFSCDGTTVDGQKLTIEVSQTDDDGTVQWQLRGNLVDVDLLKPDLTKSGLTDLKCAHAVTVLAVDDKVTCDVTANGKPAKLEITMKNDKGDVRWEVK